MNVQAKREGFVDDKQRPMVDVTPEKPETKQRATPPPEIDPSPAELPLPSDLDKWPITVKLLYKSIRNNVGEEIREVHLREPRAGDISRYGNPIRINQDGDVLIEERKMTYIIAALASVLPPFVEDM